MRITTAPKNRAHRLAINVWRQGPVTPTCPMTPRLDGKLALVTGGNAGIGLEISRGLARRGAEVIIAARTKATAEAACRAIARETGAKLSHLPLDLVDLASVKAAVDALPALAGDRSVDVLVNNAGMSPTTNTQSEQGHEMAFAVNTLAHHVFVRGLVARGLAKDARVVVLTGDIYFLAKECTPDFTFTGTRGGMDAYARSKLGNMWFAMELQRRHPELTVVLVHPGVVVTGLGGGATGIAHAIQTRMMLSPEAGAQMPLVCATQPGIERGAYYHNTMGRVILPEGDAASDTRKALALWDRMESLSSAFVSR